jgi:23S rRNA pseudouridine1911/1915/1917 synthase
VSIYLDNHLLILFKPAGIATQPDFHRQAKEWVKKKFSKPGNVFLEPIHRLDKPAQGMVLFARTSKALSRLNLALREHHIKKTYRAYVEGHLQEKKGMLKHFLFHDDFHAKIVAENYPDAKKAVLSYQVLEESAKTSLLEIFLETGRYHQIRAQFAHIGHPLLGDEKYGSRLSWQGSGIALCHSEMQLIHPITHQPLSFCCDQEAFFGSKEHSRKVQCIR